MKTIRLVLVIAFLSFGVRGADLQKIIQDTQKMAQDPAKITLVWWVPTEFWDAAMRGNPKVTDDQRAQFAKIMNNYLVFIVVSADIGPMGGISARDHDTLVKNIELSVNGKAVAPLGNDRISADALNFVTAMKPIMANMLGRFGQGMEFFLYPNPPKDAEKISAIKPGKISCAAFGDRFEWHLPLGSLLPPKTDPKTKQVFPGDYIFNPYTGDKLSDR